MGEYRAITRSRGLYRDLKGYRAYGFPILQTSIRHHHMGVSQNGDSRGGPGMHGRGLGFRV